MRHYIALIRKEAGSDYGVSFPDLPGCVTAGKDLDEARAFAVEALALHLEGMKEDKDAVPEPSNLEAVMSGRENQDAVAVLIDAPTTVAMVRVNITLQSDVLEAIDAAAERRGMNRSGFLVHAAKREIKSA